MTDKNKTHIYVLVDRSGSMEAIRSDMEGALQKYFEDQAKVPGTCLVSVAQFDTEFEIVKDLTPVASVGKIGIRPRGCTALHDSLCRFITDAGIQLEKIAEDERPGSVIFVIVTDGLENSSREHHAEDVRRMIDIQQNVYQWLFVYLGANQDAIEVGESLGIARGQTITYAPTSGGTQSVMSSVSNSTTTYRGARASGADYTVAVASASFTDEDREESMEE